jgi:hypothetical protein
MSLLPWVLAGAATLTPQAYDHGDATSDEQLVLELINRARSNPTAEGTRLGLAITEGITDTETLANAALNGGVRPPLAMNPLLLQAARAHSKDMWTRNFWGHVNPDGADPGDRITAAGYTWNWYAENIIRSTNATASTAGFHDAFVVDSGIAERGHRTNLLDWDDTTVSTASRREVGIGHFASATANGAGFRSFLTEDFARRSNTAYVVGVVHRDTTANTFYDLGEGLPGVTITVVGGQTTTTAPGGGFAVPIPGSGSITVTASGGPLNTTLSSGSIAVGGDNVYVAFRPTAGQVVDTDNDGMPDAYEIDHGLDETDNADAAGDLDADGVTNLVEYQRGTNPSDATSFPGSGNGSGTASPPPSTPPPASDDGGGGCGLLGAEILLLALLLRRRRG